MKKFKFIIKLIIIIIFILLYARFVGTLGLNNKEYSIYVEDLSNDFDGLKIIHFSDIHYKRAINENKIKSIIKEINASKPDIVVFSGDLIDKDTLLTDNDFNFLTEEFNKINATYGKYAVLGNHDYKEKEKVEEVFNKSNFLYLENDHDVIYDKEKNKIFIGGIGNVTYKLNDVDKTLEQIEKDTTYNYKIIITHEPDISDEIVEKENVSLILAGHSHNGQVRLPLLGAIYTPPYAEKYYDEYYQLKDTELYISSGIGVSTINYRLWNRPSINLYRLYKKAS